MVMVDLLKIMAVFMMVNGKIIKKKVRVFNSIPMVKFMKGIFQIIKRMVKVSIFIKMEINMKVNGLMEK